MIGGSKVSNADYAYKIAKCIGFFPCISLLLWSQPFKNVITVCWEEVTLKGIKIISRLYFLIIILILILQVSEHIIIILMGLVFACSIYKATIGLRHSLVLKPTPFFALHRSVYMNNNI